jgi:hypothetical protein
VAKHIRAQLLVEQKKNEKGKKMLKEPKEEVNNEEPSYEAVVTRHTTAWCSMQV